MNSNRRTRDKSKTSNSSNPCANRGGNYNNNGSNNPASNRNNNSTSNRNDNISPRATL